MAGTGAFIIRYAVFIDFVGAGMGSNSVPNAQQLQLGADGLFGNGTLTAPSGQPAGFQVVPGGDAPTAGNFTTAFTAMATDLTNAMAAGGNLARVQGFATGGG